MARFTFPTPVDAKQTWGGNRIAILETLGEEQWRKAKLQGTKDCFNIAVAVV